MKDEWRDFIERLEISTEFLHRDEFLERLRTHPHNIETINFPSVFISKGGRISLFIPHDEINKCKTLKDLMDLITTRLKGAYS